jgi:hypothetical protein
MRYSHPFRISPSRPALADTQRLGHGFCEYQWIAKLVLAVVAAKTLRQFLRRR